MEITKAEFNPDDLSEAIVEISIDVASIDTKSARRDKHLRTSDFFDVANHPNATLKFYDVKSVDAKKTYTAKLDFNMHGIKKTYPELKFTISQSDPIKVEGTFTFNRLDFKIGSQKKLNPMTPLEEIPITFSATLPN